MTAIANINDTVSRYIIVDLDGTLCDYSHRKHFLNNVLGERHDSSGPDWDSFNAAAINDPPKEDVLHLVRASWNEAWNIIIMTGRSDKYKDVTQQWLTKHKVRHHALLMREQGDFRSDVEVKKELYQLYLADKHVLFVLEDRDKVVEMWRSLGLTCLQVMKGEY